MKRFTALLLLCFLLMTPLTAYADLIVEPDNDFYEQHKGQIIFLGRSFVANGEDGSVPVRMEPGSKNDIAKLQNGDATYINYSCLYGGNFWGFTFEYSGWIKMEQMLVLYDYIAFEEDHLDDFYSYDGDYAGIKANRSAIAWPWPGCDAPLWTFEDLDAENFWVSYAYSDEDGREWGFVSYLYGSRNIWFCLSDPLNRDIPVFNPTPEPAPWVSETKHVDIKQDTPENEFPALILIIALVIVLVAGTAILIKILWKPNRKR
jgi:hypothetical protein